ITSQGKTVYHFDLYRLKRPEELLDIGWEDYLNSNAPIFIEWPERIANLLPENFVRIDIKIQGTTRQFEVSEL
ncbi:MAG: tRNA (adenosine(37)-N6)-threonylcarbamoyltransferase complex ATPase subunit type 1 TsaE, partial [Flavobacteriales bacterium]